MSVCLDQAQDKDGDGAIDDAGVNRDVLRLSVALDLVQKMEGACSHMTQSGP